MKNFFLFFISSLFLFSIVTILSLFDRNTVLNDAAASMEDQIARLERVSEAYQEDYDFAYSMGYEFGLGDATKDIREEFETTAWDYRSGYDEGYERGYENGYEDGQYELFIDDDVYDIDDIVSARKDGYKQGFKDGEHKVSIKPTLFIWLLILSAGALFVHSLLSLYDTIKDNKENP